jgi:hypothetical protein
MRELEERTLRALAMGGFGKRLVGNWPTPF